LAFVALGGCSSGPDPAPLPEAALAFLDPALVKAEGIADGLVYHWVESQREPWTVHLLEVDIDQCALGFGVIGLAPRGSERQTVAMLVEGRFPAALAAVNGDFFTPENEPLGIEASEGTIQGSTTRPVFAWRPGAPPQLTAVSWQGDTLQIGDDWRLVRGEPDGATELVAGFPALIRGGEWVGDLEGEARPAFALARHPRTALGLDTVGRRFWIVVLDGRREGVSEGMTLPELATLLQALGATEALNLDGGGSSTMLVNGRVVSRPSDPLGPRPVVNALTVVEDPSLCGLAQP
jgi:hypothetical protein